LRRRTTLRKWVFGCILAAFIGVGYHQPVQSQLSGPTTLAEPTRLQPSSAAASPVDEYRTVVNSYCVGCHNERVRTAGLFLDQVDVGEPSEVPEVWEKVLKKLRTRAMPPSGMPRPDEATYDALATYLETTLDRAAEVAPNPGRPVVHRLNRVEYANAVRDLLDVSVEGQSLFPAEDSGKGFDNLAALLTVSPLLMERYMSAAAKISRLAVGNPTARPAGETYQAALNIRGRGTVITVQDERVSEDVPFGSRGGIAIRHHFLADGEYRVKVQLQMDGNYYLRGLLGEPHQLDVFVDGEKVQSFSVGGERRGASGALHTRDGNIYIGEPAQQEYEYMAGGDLEGSFQAKAGQRLVGVVFRKKVYEPEGILEVFPRQMARDIGNFKGGDPGIGTVTITGPYDPTGLGDTPSRRKIFACNPAVNQEESCARKILSRLARQAYRRPVTDGEIEALLELYRTGRSEEGFEEGIRMALQGLLVSPGFLFRIEQDPPGVSPNTAYPVSDLELASRLSFFLWSSIPDETLLELAEAGKLRDSRILQEQAQRMLADGRSDALVTNFAGQWLYLRNVSQRFPNNRIYPDFDEELRLAFERETELFFDSMVREDRRVTDLLDADYTFVNQRLAQHYGIPNVFGSHFRRVTLRDENRRGLLGQGSFLLVTSRANRTAPVLRGKWVLENLLGTPPPPPPPDVPALEEKGGEVQKMTMRQRTEAHRANPACATCHVRMDPIGFALENFDGVGRWRTSESGATIDVSGELTDGTRFDGPIELREMLAGRQEQLAQTVAEKLMTYALGREVEAHDMPAVRKILREAAPEGYRWSSLISGVIESVPFQMRRSQQ
jgi:mono/diheme cytochrome c family protein